MENPPQPSSPTYHTCRNLLFLQKQIRKSKNALGILKFSVVKFRIFVTYRQTDRILYSWRLTSRNDIGKEKYLGDHIQSVVVGDSGLPGSF